MEKNKVALSIVVPVFNEEMIIETLVQRMSDAAKSITDSYEIIFVNDGSKDSSLQRLKFACDQDPKLHYISFSRNFGHQIAISAGMDNASGDAIVTIDGDLQDPPELIPEINNGQLIKIIRDKYMIDAIGYNKIKGTPIARTELVNAISELL